VTIVPLGGSLTRGQVGFHWYNALYLRAMVIGEAGAESELNSRQQKIGSESVLYRGSAGEVD
jgi:hypothetical protein